MLFEGIVGPQTLTSGSVARGRLTYDGSVGTQDTHGRFQEAVLRGNVYYMALAAAAGTAFIGAAGGTPLFGVMNPLRSVKNLVFLGVGCALRAAATGAGQTGLVLWAGTSALPTGTVTAPTNALTQQASGASGVGFSNTAMTGSTAITVALPLFTHYWATAAAAFASPGFFDIGGLVVATPGVLVALGLTVIPTSLTADAAIYWEEVPSSI